MISHYSFNCISKAIRAFKTRAYNGRDKFRSVGKYLMPTIFAFQLSNENMQQELNRNRIIMY